MKGRFFYALAFLFTLCACAQRAPIVPPPVTVAPPALPPLVRLSEAQWPQLHDDQDLPSLGHAVAQSADYYASLPADRTVAVGQDSYSVKELHDSLIHFEMLIKRFPDQWLSKLKEDFVLYQSTGSTETRDVIFSAYYEFEIPARLKRDAVYRYPLYKRPPDLIDVDLGLFDPAYQGARIAGRRDGSRLVPYPSREQIDSEGYLEGKGLEIAWAKDPLDILFLQIEGSGWLVDGENKTRVRYDGTNALPFRSVGQHLITSGRIPKDQFNRERFKTYMNAHSSERGALLNVNPRYVFFRIDRSASAPWAYGNIQKPLTPWRSVAADPRLIPKGALGWMDVEQGDQRLRRFVVVQDEGGAIRGPARIDYFVGGGDEAERFAWNFWNKGRFYLLVKRVVKKVSQ